MTIDTMLDTILTSEGGYQNQAADNGNWTGGRQNVGKLLGTKYGITPKTLAAWRGVKASSLTEDDIKNLTETEARDIYKDRYYYKPGFDRLPEHLQENVMDMGINAGPKTAIKLLQKAAGVKADGNIGNQTLSAVQNIDNNTYADQRKDHYLTLTLRNPEKYDRYIKGWLNRVDQYRTPTQATDSTPQASFDVNAETQGPPDLFARPPSPYSDGSFFSNSLMQQGEDFLSRIKKAIGWN